jgi:hypothetical protein
MVCYSDAILRFSSAADIPPVVTSRMFPAESTNTSVGIALTPPNAASASGEAISSASLLCDCSRNDFTARGSLSTDIETTTTFEVSSSPMASFVFLCSRQGGHHVAHTSISMGLPGFLSDESATGSPSSENPDSPSTEPPLALGPSASFGALSRPSTPFTIDVQTGQNPVNPLIVTYAATAAGTIASFSTPFSIGVIVVPFPFVRRPPSIRGTPRPTAERQSGQPVYPIMPRPRQTPPPPAALAGILCLLVSLMVPGCGKRVSAESYYAVAASGRSSAAAAMAADWRAQRLKLDDCITLASDRLTQKGDAASTAFAGAVLDMAGIIERELPQSGDYELFWIRIGSLAGLAAEKAALRHDYQEARSLVLAGPKRWQTEAFWRRHTQHDALASMMLFDSGEKAEALNRLRQRGDLDELQQAAYDTISRSAAPKPGGG